MISKTHISVQKLCGRQLNIKVCGIESAIFLLCFLFRPLCQTTISQKQLNTHRHFITKVMLITVWNFKTTQHLYSYKFTLVDKAVLSFARLLSDAIF